MKTVLRLLTKIFRPSPHLEGYEDAVAQVQAILHKLSPSQRQEFMDKLCGTNHGRRR